MEWLKRHGRRTAGLVGVAGAAALALTACGQSASAEKAPESREAKYKRVIEDPRPTPADVIEMAGAPSGVSRAGDGSLLLTYDADNVEDDEGPAATAWRLLGPDGRTVAEHAEHANAEDVPAAFKGVPGGFVSVPPGEGTGLDLRGKRHEVVLAEAPSRTRAGDILLSAREPTLVYRPATRTLAPPAGLSDAAVDVAVDERGTVWSLDQPLTDEPNRVVRQRDGRTLGSVDVPKSYSGGPLVARGGTAALALATDEGVRGLMVTTDDGTSWRTLLAGGIPWESLDGGPGLLILELLADGRLLVGGEGGRYWLADDDENNAFHELETPATFTSLTVEDDTLYGIADATTATYDLVKGEGLWISRDGGREWERRE
ncbi:hypothetical protein F9278_00900 [Streptomyces phaeolivaceus]|uniref:Exo-alpha-sialidase n=1 Tax=Streptomyces phaeolivaceus TaxID=2653200 RepID=A0A5P8JX35_9ACTN|nr:hypothetical protein [Streptomyces phaeolivaceus]QFQ94987.1 hypothetical protein F9278_00900 [Streptomyces phaeolivaceus]